MFHSDVGLKQIVQTRRFAGFRRPKRNGVCCDMFHALETTRKEWTTKL